MHKRIGSPRLLNLVVMAVLVMATGIFALVAAPTARAAQQGQNVTAGQTSLLGDVHFDASSQPSTSQHITGHDPCPYDQTKICSFDLTVTIVSRTQVSTSSAGHPIGYVLCGASCGGGGGCSGTHGISIEAFFQQYDGFGGKIYHFGHYMDGQYNCSSAMVQGVYPFEGSDIFYYGISNTGSFGQPSLNTWSNCWCYNSSDGRTWPTHAHSQFNISVAGTGSWSANCESWFDQYSNGRVECYDHF